MPRFLRSAHCLPRPAGFVVRPRLAPVARAAQAAALPLSSSRSSEETNSLTDIDLPAARCASLRRETSRQFSVSDPALYSAASTAEKSRSAQLNRRAPAASAPPPSRPVEVRSPGLAMPEAE